MSAITSLRRWMMTANGYIVGVFALIILYRMYRDNDARYPDARRRTPASDGRLTP